MDIINVGSRITNDYIFPVKGGYVLVDTGSEKEFEHFRSKLQEKMIEPKHIAFIFITHAHDDHTGFLNELMHYTEAKIILHPKAAEEIRQGRNTFIGGCPSRFTRMVFKQMARRGHSFPPLEKVFEDRLLLVDGENKSELEKALAVRIIETPGHTGCSLSLLRDDGILFCGDAAMNGFPSSHRAAMLIDYPDRFCESWIKIIALKPKIIYPGHGKPFPVSDLEKNLPWIRKMKLYPLLKA